MSDIHSIPTTVVQSRREARPERIDIIDDVLVRNDIIAKKYGASERTINRGDAGGAPFTYIGGVKYRPERQYDEYVAGLIQVRGQPPVRRRRSSHR